MKDESAGALFEGILIGGGSGRGSAFGTAYIPAYAPPFPPVENTAPAPLSPQEAFDAHKKCCRGTNPSCRGCDNCGTR